MAKQKFQRTSLEPFELTYCVGDVLGTGGYGMVYAGIRLHDGKAVAIKHVFRHNITEWSVLGGSRVPLELKLLVELQAIPGVVRLVDYYEKRDSFLYVMDKIPYSRDLFQYITERGMLEEPLAKTIFRQVLQTIILCLSLIHI